MAESLPSSPGPGVGNSPGTLTVPVTGETPANPETEPLRIQAEPGPEKPASSKKDGTKRDTESDNHRTKNNRAIGQSRSACVLAVYKAEPDRMIHVDEVSKKTGITKDTVNRSSSRLKNEGKLRNPVKGFYQYDPLYEVECLKELARSGDWRIENAEFVRKVVWGTSGQLTETVPADSNQTTELDHIGQKQDNNWTEPDTSVPKPHPGYPSYLRTGQEVFRGTYYSNGTEIIRISAKGKPPISLDLALHLIDSFQLKDDEWQCTRIEVNKNSRARKFEGSFTMKVLGALLIKAYQHYPGDVARLEIANRKTISMREVTDLFNYLDAGITTAGLTRQFETLKKEVTSLKKDTRYAVNTIAKLQDRIPPRIGADMDREQSHPTPPPFATGTEIKRREQAPAVARGEPVSHERNGTD